MYRYVVWTPDPTYSTCCNPLSFNAPVVWCPTQRTAAAVCLELTMALVNSYEDTIDQEHFALRYESFSLLQPL